MVTHSYILDGTRHTVTRDPDTGICCLYQGPETQPPEHDALVQRWQTAPDDGGESPATVAPAHRPENAQNGPEMPGNTRRKAQRPAPVLEGQAALF
jgi:hypothetical protein